MALDPKDLETARRVLEAIAEDRGELAALSEPERIALLKSAGEVARPSKAARKQLAKEHRRKHWQERRAQDAAKLDTTGIRRAREQAVYVTPAASELGRTPLHTLPEADALDSARQPSATTATATTTTTTTNSTSPVTATSASSPSRGCTSFTTRCASNVATSTTRNARIQRT